MPAFAPSSTTAPRLKTLSSPHARAGKSPLHHTSHVEIEKLVGIGGEANKTVLRSWDRARKAHVLHLYPHGRHGANRAYGGLRPSGCALRGPGRLQSALYGAVEVKRQSSQRSPLTTGHISFLVRPRVFLRPGHDFAKRRAQPSSRLAGAAGSGQGAG